MNYILMTESWFSDEKTEAQSTYLGDLIFFAFYVTFVIDLKTYPNQSEENNFIF